MIRLIGLWLVGCAMCVTPSAADEDVYDGPTAIKPLTVTPQQSAPPNTVCDFEHQCYPEKGGPTAPPAVATKPVAPRPPLDSSLNEPLVKEWSSCVSEALQNYEQSHDLHAMQVATSRCQAKFSGTAAGPTEVATEPPLPVPQYGGPQYGEPQYGGPQRNGRRDIGCGWWPVGSDADRDCAAGGYRF